MSSKTNKRKSKKPPTDVRVMIKLGWNGTRLPISSKCTIKSTLLQLIYEIQDKIPSIVLDGMDISGEEDKEPTILHLRMCVPRSQWESTTLEKIGAVGGSSALLTLHLPGSATPNTSTTTNASAEKQSDESSNDLKMPAVSKPSPPPSNNTLTESIPAAPSSSTLQSIPEQKQPQQLLTCEGALNKLMSSHFDVDSKDCIKTLIKVLDNILYKPGEKKTRTIRFSNPAFHKKVGSKAGGIEFLLACGFTAKDIGQANNNNVAINANSTLELLPANESPKRLMEARQLLQKRAVEVGVSKDDLPTIRPIPKTIAPSHNTNNNTSSTGSFNIYRTHAHNTQAASLGANNTSGVGGGIGPDGTVYVSKIQRELDSLNKKQEMMEKKMKNKPLDRNWTAYRLGEQQSSSSSTSAADSFGESTRGDGALIAQRAQRMEMERKKREEGGFTTKAMRDLEKMKKAKVFTHAQLRICFPDGLSISGNFHPSETIGNVCTLLKQHVFVDDPEEKRQFEFFITPPKRTLPNNSTLSQEGLVPAARVFVSWKNGYAPDKNVDYIQPNLFRASSSEITAAFPSAASVDNAKNNMGKNSSGEGGGKSKKMSEEDLIKQMMGGGKSSGLRKGGDSETKKSSSNSKGKGLPKWFK